ncbi:MAG: formylglycine-generating enzyme family protein [Planctomycetota bacterium]
MLHLAWSPLLARRPARALCLGLLLCAGSPTAAQTAPSQKALLAAQTLVDEARAERDAAAAAIEDLVASLQDDYVALTGGPQAATLRHTLVLAVQDSLPTARARLSVEAGKGRAVLRGTRRQILIDALGPAVDAAAPVDRRLCAWIARQFAEQLSEQDSWEGLSADALLAVLAGLFPPNLTWYQFWNASFHEGLPEAERWTRANVAYEAAGLRLDRLLQPERYGSKGEIAPLGMVIVPGGNYDLGPNSGWERPARRVALKVFAIDRHEVTQAEYALYVNSLAGPLRSAALPRGWRLDAQGAIFDRETADHPVHFVSWTQAASYAAWAGKRLPTEDEWEAAAAGTQGFIFPWGQHYQEEHANGDGLAESLLPVESFPHARSPVGAYDLAGNVWEWTATLEDGTNVKSLPEGLVNAIIRGGGFDSRRDELSTRYRRSALAHDTFAAPRYKLPIGFRCVQDL